MGYKDLLTGSTVDTSKPMNEIPSVETTLYGGVLGHTFSQSLMKHTCNPNTDIFIQNRQCIAFATRTIRSGEKVSPHWEILRPSKVILIELTIARCLKIGTSFFHASLAIRGRGEGKTIYG